MNKLVLITTIIFSSNIYAENTHTVQWFLKHKKEMSATLERCADNPADLRNTSECINARAALKKASVGTW